MSRAALAALVLAALAGCGGGEERTQVTNVLVPPERQRADLLRAHAMGLLTVEELEVQMGKIGR